MIKYLTYGLVVLLLLIACKVGYRDLSSQVLPYNKRQIDAALINEYMRYCFTEVYLVGHRYTLTSEIAVEKDLEATTVILKFKEVGYDTDKYMIQNISAKWESREPLLECVEPSINGFYFWVIRKNENTIRI